ncbi:MAG TPA: Ppx/GppA phosphatase family protein [Thermohalobaculum sp.]|nr:Ppx/GppA phosphatase family protein [Thermohalobaculum sp.]
MESESDSLAASETAPGRGNDGPGPVARAARLGSPAPLAALDLGTNNCRLLVVEPEGESFRVIDAFSRAVRLGEGVEHSNALSDVAQLRALKALRICASKIRQHGVTDTRMIATEACRRATNGRAFVRRVAREIGLAMDIITPEDEARLAVAGCAPLIDSQAEQLLVFDIGGGSTELIWIDLSMMPPHLRPALVRALAPPPAHLAGNPTSRAAAAHITDWISVPVGVSTLTERYRDIGDDAERLAAMSADFEQQLATFAPYAAIDRAALTGKLQIVGVSGTATTFGAFHLGLRSYDRARVDGLWLGASETSAVAARLVALGRQGRARHPGIGPTRSELVLSGAAIMMTILRAWPVARLRIADRGLREGMLYGLMQQRAAGL